MKFALRVEEELNKILYPEYRQLIVESLMILSLLLDRDQNFHVNKRIELGQLLSISNNAFLTDQVVQVQIYIWDRVFKSGLSKSCGRQPL